MSFADEIRNLNEALHAAKAGSKMGSRDPQSLIRSLISSFPDDLSLSGSIHGLSDSSPLNLDDQPSGMLTPIRVEHSAVSTPSLSLPDSFDADYAALARRGRSRECARCGELEQQAAQERQTLLGRVGATQRALDEALLQKEALGAELFRTQRMAAIRGDNQSLEMQMLSERSTRLSQSLEAEAALRRAGDERAQRCDLAEAEAARLGREMVAIRTAGEQSARAVECLAQSEAEARRVAADVERVRELLVQDKAHLQQEGRLLQSRVDEKSREAREGRASAAALETKLAQLTDQLLTLQLSARSGFDQRMEQELGRIREDNLREVEGMRAASRDILDRENRVLRETKTSLENECNQLRLRSDQVGQQMLASQEERSAQLHEKNSLLAESRAEIKLRCFELTSLGTLFEEKAGALRAAEMEVGVLRQEVGVHRAAVQQLEGESLRELSRLRAELEGAEGKLRAYEELEQEIDTAVMRTAGRASDVGGLGGLSARAEEEAEAASQLLHSVKGIPTNPARRIRQAVFLAQRLLEAERGREGALEQLEQARAVLGEVTKQAEVAKENLSRAAQPHAYLVSKLREQEGKVTEAVARCKVLEGETATARRGQAAAVQEAVHLRDRLGSLLQQRGELQAVKAMLAQMHAMEEGSSDGGDEDGDEYADEDEDGENGDGHGEEHDSPHLGKGVGKGVDKGVGMGVEGMGEQKEGSPPRTQGSTSAPASPEDMIRVASALGLSPEQLHHMTSSPRQSP
ncbi:hypothetical protein B484DRAFT_419235 [Ochromonadaceae sp. CCMP2298]|nr:hypothetical protein B484DRAFT_419235 [Ochromonadaceae sp. CCMP2298]